MAYVYQVSAEPKKRGFDFLSSLSVTLWLIIIDVVVYFTLILNFPNQTIDIGGKAYQTFHPFIQENIAIGLENISELRIWTFVTSMFMHGGIFHLFMNMISLLFVGGLVEKLLGKKRYLYFYLLCGIAAGLFYIIAELFFPSGLVAVGASGALFGLVGFLMLITPNLPVYVFFIPIPIKMKYAAPGLLIVLWLISIAADIPIGNTAHLGGLVAGLLYGVYVKKKYKRKAKAISRYFS